MGGGKKHKIEKAFKPLRDKFDKGTQERTLAAQKAKAQRRDQIQQRSGSQDDTFRQQQAALLARRTGVKKTGRKVLSLAEASFSLTPAAAAGDKGSDLNTEQMVGDKGGQRLKYSADRLLQGEKTKAPAAEPVDAASNNRFALLYEQEEEPLRLQPSLLGSFVPFAAAP